MQQQHYSNGHFPAGKHPFLKLNGRPIAFLFREGSYAPEGDPSNFNLDGKLGQVLRSPAFAKFMHPYYDSDDAPGRTIVQIWHWIASKLDLRPWKDQSPSDLEWLEERLQALDFLSRRMVDGQAQWSYEDF